MCLTVGESKTISAFDFMPSFRSIFRQYAIDPGNSGGHRRKVDVIDHGMCITGLTFAAANVLLDFLET